MTVDQYLSINTITLTIFWLGEEKATASQSWAALGYKKKED